MHSWRPVVPEGELYCYGIAEYGREGYVRQVLTVSPANSQANLWNFVGFYPDVRMEREEVWLELRAVGSLFNEPWVIARNFNTVRFPFVMNCTKFNKTMVDFFEFIEEMVPEPGGYSIGRLQLYMDKRERPLYCRKT